MQHFCLGASSWGRWATPACDWAVRVRCRQLDFGRHSSGFDWRGWVGPQGFCLVRLQNRSRHIYIYIYTYYIYIYIYMWQCIHSHLNIIPTCAGLCFERRCFEMEAVVCYHFKTQSFNKKSCAGWNITASAGNPHLLLRKQLIDQTTHPHILQAPPPNPKSKAFWYNHHAIATTPNPFPQQARTHANRAGREPLQFLAEFGQLK